jgi:hypothetical protein
LGDTDTKDDRSEARPICPESRGRDTHEDASVQQKQFKGQAAGKTGGDFVLL